MFVSINYPEMNHAVPGLTVSPPRMDRHVADCEVPSPSQWSDPSRSPFSLHSPPPPIFPCSDFDKLKEEPFSPSNNCFTAPSCARSSSSFTPMMSEDNVETTLNLSELLNENTSLIAHVVQRRRQEPHEQRQKRSNVATFNVNNEALLDFAFLDSLVEVKKEIIDETFEQQQHYPPHPSHHHSSSSPLSQQIGTGGTTSPQQCNNNFLGDSLLTVELMALDHCRQDVESVSTKLNIPKDPTAWSPTDVRAWLEYQAGHLGIPVPHFDNWFWTGVDLNKLSESQFREWIPHGGELFYAKLEIWREALRASFKLESSRDKLGGPSGQFGVLGGRTLQSSLEASKPSHDALSPLSIQTQLDDAISSYAPTTPTPILQSPTTSSTTNTTIQSNLVVSPFSSILHHHRPMKSVDSLSPDASRIPTTIFKLERDMLMECPTSTPQQHLLNNCCTSSSSPTTTLTFSPMEALSPTGSSESTEFDTFLAHCSSTTQSVVTAVKTEKTDNSQADAAAAEKDTSQGPRGEVRSGGGGGSSHIHLWQFLKELLAHPQLYCSCIRWVDRAQGVFKIEDSVRVARLWGKRKNRPAMNYDKLSRSIRQYYKKGIMKKTERSQRLVYQFCHPYNL